MPIVGSFAGASSRAYGLQAGLIGDFESIATVNVGSGGQAAIEFTSIPSTYTHLQIRSLNQTNRATFARDEFRMTVNADTGANYSWHNLLGTGAAASSGAGASASYVLGQDCVGATGYWGCFVLDILDYKDTNKYTTFRYIAGLDTNNAGASGAQGAVSLGSGNWRNTNAITSVKFVPTSGTLWNQYSSFALYGIKG